MRKFPLFCAFSLFLVSSASAAGINSAAGSYVSPGLAAAPAQQKEWTVLVFINGKNNLEPFGLKDLNEMETAGSTGRVNIVVELGRIYDLVRRVAEGTGSAGVKAAAQRLNGILKGSVVGYNRTTNSTGGPWGANPVNYDNSNGLAVYLPSVPAAEGYSALRWSADSNWDEFMSWLSAK